MKYRYILLLLIGFILFNCKPACAQLVGDNTFLQGQFLEVGVAPNGCWGNTVNVPAGYHTHTGSAISSYPDPLTGAAATGNGLDFSYDKGHDGWATGQYYGSYFLPGIPFLGWSMQVGGVRSDAFYTDAPSGFYNAAGGTLTGTNVGYTNSGGICTGTWLGSASTGGGLIIRQTTRVDTLASWAVVTTVFKNTTATAITGLYYLATGDPDNDETVVGGTGFPTTNHIVYQNDIDHRVMVCAHSVDTNLVFSALATKDCRAKAYIYSAWPPTTVAGNNLDLVYAGTSTGLVSTWYTLGTTTTNMDIAYGLIYDIGTVPALDSAVISYAWVFDDTFGVDEAFPDPMISVAGTVVDSIDTISGCSAGTTVPVNILFGTDKAWTWSDWNWSPATGLATTTGTSNIINIGSLTSPVTYTITGTNSRMGDCATKTLILYVTPCFFAQSNGPCPGDTLKLSAHGGDSVGATYYWYGPTGFTSTKQNPTIAVISPGDTGIYHVVKTIGGIHDSASVHVVLAFYPVVTAGTSAPICSGNTFSLTATPDSVGEIFSWTGPNGFSSGVQNPTITGAPVKDSGTYKVYTTLNGCRDSNTVHVVIDSTPAQPAPGSNGPICTGSTLMLTASDGTPGVSYSWGGPGSFISTLQDPTIGAATVAASGVYTVTVTLGTCSSSDTLTVVVNPLPPAPVLGSGSPICSGNPLDLTATDAVTGCTYSWTGPNAFSSTLENPIITPATVPTTGTYSVTATFGTCVSPVATEAVVVDSTPVQPTLGSNAPICAGTTLLLTSADGTLGVTYSWAGPPSFTSVLQNPSIAAITVAGSGVYTVTATLGICSSSDTLTVVIKPQPTLPVLTSLAPLCSGNALSLTATDLPGCTYSWAGPNSFTSTLENPVIVPATLAATGTYSVVATLAGCVSPMATESVVVDSTPVIPTFITNNGPICSGGTLSFTATSPTAGITYSWSGPLGFSSPLQNPFIVGAPAAASGIYTVTVTLGTCSSYSTTPVLVKPTPALSGIGSNGPICSGNTLLLNCLFAPSGGVYTWSGPNSFVSALQNPSITLATLAAGGTYRVSEALAGCFSDTASLTVVIDSTPVTPVASTNSPGPPGLSICKGDTLKLFATDATAGVTYLWGGPPAFTSTDENPVIPNTTLSSVGIYTITATLGPCASATEINVVITPRPALIATSNSPVCSGVGDTLFLQAVSGPGATFVWSGPYTFSSSLQNPFRAPTLMEYSGVYQVTAYLSGCYATINDTVTIRPTPPTAVAPWLSYCQNHPAPPLQAMGDSVLWYATNVPTGGSLTPPVPPTDRDTVMWFYMTQTHNTCTSAIDSMKITVNPSPTVTVNGDIFACPHDTAVLTAVDTDPIAYYHWYPGLYLSDTVGASVITRPENDMHYTVVVTNQFGCMDTAEVSVRVYAGALLYLGDSVTLYPGQTYQLSPQTNCTSFTWFPPSGLSNAYISNPVAAPEFSTKYIVHGETSWGCTAEDSINIYVSTETILALPNAFTPGSGTPNGTFKIIKYGLASLQYFRVFDRWGVKVFETTDIDAGWDGTYNGTPQPFGVYVYEVGAVTSTGHVFEKHGNLTLIR